MSLVNPAVPAITSATPAAAAQTAAQAYADNGHLLKTANNLSDVTAATARTNLGLNAAMAESLIGAATAFR